MRVFLATLIFSLTFHQLAAGKSKIYKAKEYYPDGQLKYEGRYTICVKRDVEHFMDIYEHRKYGKWTYYHPSGEVKRIEYHSKTTSCEEESVPTGTWQYFNKNGILYKEEQYENGVLCYSKKEIYDGESYLGKIENDHGNIHSEIPGISSSKNLVPNPGFEEYFYKPVDIENDGQDPIENIIPSWYSPDAGTPDYYNEYRSIAGVPVNLNSSTKLINGKGYVGLMLFFHPNYRYEQWEPQNKTDYSNEYTYSESIQTKLSKSLAKNEIYCFKAQLVLSQNAGLASDKFGVYFSDDSAFFKNNHFPGNPQITFDISGNSSLEWQQLCHAYKAVGNEMFITLGRFSSPDHTLITQKIPHEKSDLDINKSAYYLLDNIELFKVSSSLECNCKVDSDSTTTEPKIQNKSIPPFTKIGDSRYVLKNVLFEFDKWDIPENALDELYQLRLFLSENPSAKIMLSGYTDSAGSASYNLELSLKRAEAVKTWLVEKGIETERISCSGFGYDQPVDASKDVDYLNRRVEFEILEQ